MDGGPFDVVSLGAWSVATRAGAIDADPYTRAALERSGEIPLALGEGLRLIALVDDDGRPLKARCVYRVAPRTPAARYWTLENCRSQRISGSTIRREIYLVFCSSEIMRESDGSFAIYVSAAAHAGNWLPIGANQPFALALRLYDFPLSATAGGIEKAAAPAVTRKFCA